MQSIDFNQISSERVRPWFYAFIFFQLFIWTLAPIAMRYTLPMDALEGTTWGHQLEWGYDKNPFMNAWLTSFAVFLGGSQGWGTYLFSQLSVVVSFWAVWRLGIQILSPITALLSVLLLAVNQYYNLHAIDFNDNTLELSLWALTTLYFYQAVTRKHLSDWILTGLFAGLSMMTKYFVGMLLIPMLCFMLLFPETRQAFRKSGVYVGLLVFIAVITPHFIWLFNHDFITLSYAVNRVNSEPSWTNHIFFPLQFAWQQVEVFLPSAALLLILFLGKKNLTNSARSYPRSFDKLFLLVVGIGPFICTVLLSAVMGMKLRAGWGQPLMTFWGLCFFAWYMPSLTTARLRNFIIVLSIVMLGTAIGYCVSLFRAPEPSSANFPGKNIAVILENNWHDTYHVPLNYVVGARWVAGNIAFYSNDKPAVFIDGEKKLSPWIDEEKLRKSGAIFIWDPTESWQMSQDDIKKRFPNLGPVRTMHFAWMRNRAMKPVEMQVAFLAPDQTITPSPQHQLHPVS